MPPAAAFQIFARKLRIAGATRFGLLKSALAFAPMELRHALKVRFGMMPPAPAIQSA